MLHHSIFTRAVARGAAPTRCPGTAKLSKVGLPQANIELSYAGVMSGHGNTNQARFCGATIYPPITPL